MTEVRRDRKGREFHTRRVDFVRSGDRDLLAHRMSGRALETKLLVVIGRFQKRDIFAVDLKGTQGLSQNTGEPFSHSKILNFEKLVETHRRRSEIVNATDREGGQGGRSGGTME